MVSWRLGGVASDEYLKRVLQRISTTPMGRIAEPKPLGCKARREAEAAEASAIAASERRALPDLPSAGQWDGRRRTHRPLVADVLEEAEY